jgi:hypothetical protein
MSSTLVRSLYSQSMTCASTYNVPTGAYTTYVQLGLFSCLNLMRIYTGVRIIQHHYLENLMNPYVQCFLSAVYR